MLNMPRAEIKRQRNGTEAKPTEPARSAATPKRGPIEYLRQRGDAILGRIGPGGLAVALAVVALGVLGARWGTYRHTNVVTSEAVLGGVVTHLGSRIDGQIKAVYVEMGQRVVPGQILARLVDDHLTARVSLASAELERAQRVLAVAEKEVSLEARLLEAQLREAEAAVGASFARAESAQSALSKWDRDYERFETLLSSGAASVEHMDRIATGRHVAMANAASGRAMREAALAAQDAVRIDAEASDVRIGRLGILESEVHAGQALVAKAEADLRATEIRAPDHGWVVSTAVAAGSSVRVSDALLSLWIGDRVWVDAWISETQLSHVRLGSEADITLAAYGDKRMTGRVEAIGAVTESGLELSEGTVTASILPQTAKLNVRIALDPVDALLVPGLSATVGIRRTQGADARGFLAAWFRTAPQQVENDS